jgi:hypothetical protein
MEEWSASPTCLTATLKERFAEGAKLEQQIRKNLKELGYE